MHDLRRLHGPRDSRRRGSRRSGRSRSGCPRSPRQGSRRSLRAPLRRRTRQPRRRPETRSALPSDARGRPSSSHRRASRARDPRPATAGRASAPPSARARASRDAAPARTRSARRPSRRPGAPGAGGKRRRFARGPSSARRGCSCRTHEPAVEVGVAELLVLEQLPDDEQRPALADDVERVRDRAVLVVALAHAGECSACSCEMKDLTCKLQVTSGSLPVLVNPDARRTA